MNCPRCESALDERERDGVTIDVCTRCRGVWLDRGELEKLIAYAQEDARRYEEGPSHRSSGPSQRQDGFFPPSSQRDEDYSRRKDDSDAYGVLVGRDGKPRKRRWYESLGDLFD